MKLIFALWSALFLSACLDAQALPKEFRLTASQWSQILDGLPPESRARAAADPGRFLGDYKVLFSQPTDLLVLVDKRFGLPEGYEPADLVSLNGTGLTVGRKDLQLRKAYLPAWLKLNKAAKAAGLTLLFSSSYRSAKYQTGLYNRYVAKDGQAAADRYSARPGHSQHQLGTVVDFGDVTEAFAATKEGKWLQAHGGEFGFSLSYPKNGEAFTGYQWEPWHWRYIGVEACTIQKNWFADTQQFLLEFHHRWGKVLADAYVP